MRAAKICCILKYKNEVNTHEEKNGFGYNKNLCNFVCIRCTFFYHTEFYRVPVTDKNMIIQVALKWLFTICVPLFIMLTGYLQNEKKPEIKYFKKLIPILGIYVFYSVLSIIMRITYLNEEKSLLSWIKAILVFDADKYAWYINMYIGLFLLTPFLNMIHEGLNSAKDYRIFLFILIFLTGFPAFFNSLASRTLIFKALVFTDWWTMIYPITYYFIGAYIKKYPVKISRKVATLSLVLIIALETWLTVFYSRNSTFVNVIGDYGSILIVVETVLFFLIFYDIEIESERMKKILSTVSVLSLDLYLCSYISDKLVYVFLMKNIFKSQQQIIFYFVFAVSASFTIAFVIAFVRYKAVRLKPVKNFKIL